MIQVPLKCSHFSFIGLGANQLISLYLIPSSPICILRITSIISSLKKMCLQSAKSFLELKGRGFWLWPSHWVTLGKSLNFLVLQFPVCRMKLDKKISSWPLPALTFCDRMCGFVFYKHSEELSLNGYLSIGRNIKYKTFCSSETWLKARNSCFPLNQLLISNTICFIHSLIIRRVCNFSEGKDCISLINCVSVAPGTEEQLRNIC